MENSNYKKFYGPIIATFCVYIAACSVILTFMMKTAAADAVLGQSPEGGWYVGISLSSTVGFGLSSLGIIFSIVSIASGGKKPELLKGLGIAIFVFFMISMAAMAGGSIAVSQSLADVIYCSAHNSSAAWRANCSEDIINDSVIIVCMILMAGISVLGIVSTVKLVTTVSKMSPGAGTARAKAAAPQAAAPQAAVQVQGKPKYCSSCGTPNDENAEFCKNCGGSFS